MRLPVLTAAVLFTAVAGCAPESAEQPLATAMTSAHAAALRDSVRVFLIAYAEDLSAPPLGQNAQAALARFYSRGIVMTTDLAPTDPVLIQTLDSLVPPTELVSQPAWIRSTRFEWGPLVITPLAPGVASYSAKYAEHVTDTSGAETALPGAQQGVVRHEADGWRIVAVQSTHPLGTHRAQEALANRMTRPR